MIWILILVLFKPIEPTVGNKSEEGEDDVKSSCPLCHGWHMFYNDGDKGRGPAKVS